MPVPTRDVNRFFHRNRTDWLGLRHALKLASHLAIWGFSATANAQQPARDKWFASWAASLLAPAAWDTSNFPTLSNRTVRQVLHTSIGGDRLRIRVSNEYGDKLLVIGSAHIALRTFDEKIALSSDRLVRFGGRDSVTIRPGATIVSDPVQLKVPSAADLLVSFYLPAPTRLWTTAMTGGHDDRQRRGVVATYLSAPGNFAGEAEFPVDAVRASWLFLSGLDVGNPPASGVVVAFGSSITGGAGAPPGGSWPDILATRLLSANRSGPLAVVNASINGNRLLSPGNGPSSLARFDRDVLMQPGVSHVILLEGTNDIGRAVTDSLERVTAEDIIFGLRQVVSRARERHLVIICGTLTPVGGNRNFGRPPVTHSPQAETMRRVVNEWIRSSKTCDDVVDFDVIVRDPERPEWLRPVFDSGDHIHLNAAGYAAMGQAIDLAVFSRAR